jgi:quercetin dioxygenase-like cupin family protein
MFLDFINISEIDFTKSSHPGQLKKVVFKGSEMKSSVTQVAYAQLQAGEIIQEHLHDSMEEVFFILDGSCEFYLNLDVIILNKESVIKVQPKVKHKIKAITDVKLFYIGIEL